MSSEHDVTVADAIADLARHHQDAAGQALIDLLTAGYIAPFRRPDGAIAYRITPAGQEYRASQEGRS